MDTYEQEKQKEKEEKKQRKEEWKKLTTEEKIAEWDKVGKDFDERRSVCKKFAIDNILCFDHYNDNKKYTKSFTNEYYFDNYDGVSGDAIACRHCGKIMVSRGGHLTLGRFTKLMISHLLKVHNIQIGDYYTELFLMKELQKLTMNAKTKMSNNRDG